ncbi:putative pollen-specific leucine-rich repeat extensin-like protein 3 [Iris pallida]|uniref:Pollen-specific leucine-rich repeat extensin-like protein 3 n=1 Tax=Iris pallida TaxID=29817 RepID=A0AAX6IRS7_IRIPA|nr:putative pollen-specific leucine-rich repeat extensin-like protein 3 [Iris pallida]
MLSSFSLSLTSLISNTNYYNSTYKPDHTTRHLLPPLAMAGPPRPPLAVGHGATTAAITFSLSLLLLLTHLLLVLLQNRTPPPPIHLAVGHGATTTSPGRAPPDQAQPRRAATSSDARCHATAAAVRHLRVRANGLPRRRRPPTGVADPRRG